ncbi:MAG: hypothetical protein KF752_20550 [Pirellulaceae bacterium]|nr:hypothetical protein [Pirellulaceae bacterium]
MSGIPNCFTSGMVIRFIKSLAFIAILAWTSLAFADQGAASRWSTFNEGQHQLYALCLQPGQQQDYARPDGYEIAVLFDTSASQTGWIRREALEVLEELVATLPVGAQVGLIACDIQAVPMTTGLVSPSDPAWQQALERLRQRVPLGATNLSGAIRSAAELLGNKPTMQRTIIYLGDGVNRSQFLTPGEHRMLIDDLVSRQITFSSLAIGPFTDVNTLAAIANHTGGVLYNRDAITESTQVIGRNLGLSTALPVVWIENAELPRGIANHFPQRFPPLRLDRDTVVVGQLDGDVATGQVKLVGLVAGQPIELKWQVTPEPSHPDMGFLTSVIDRVRSDGGLNLPALGSDGLRSLSHALADDAVSLIKSGEFALRSGQPESALRIAEEALKRDPENPAALQLRKASLKAIDADDKSIPVGKLMQFNGPAAADRAQSSLLSETLAASDLLAQEQELRRAAAQAMQQHVRHQLGDARKLSSQDPTGVKNSLKLLLEEVDSTTDVDAATRQQLRDQIGSAIAQASLQEVKLRQRLAQSEVVRAQADAAQRILNDTRRSQESLKQLVEHFNYLMAQQRYLEASKDVSPEIEKQVPDSVLAVVTREESSLLSNQALVMDAFKRREQGFIDAMRGVEEAAVPFDGYPSPVIYPPPEIWQALSARRKERYSAVSLSSGDDQARGIYSALKQSTSNNQFNGQPLSQVIQGLADEFKIPMWMNLAELENDGIEPDAPITLELPPISLRSLLRLLLEPLNLTYIVRNEVLEITTLASVEKDPVTRIYPVGDLVVPRMPMGGGMMGGMMGGMGGGMMGGMGGGMGGMGGGMMGGMGGGMGGMGGGMGGMGGGMFAVPDDTTKQAPTAKPKTTASTDPKTWVRLYEKADDQATDKLNTRVQTVVQQCVEVAEAHLEAGQLDKARDAFEKVIQLIGGLLSAGYPQPWMYQALSLSMEACNYPAEEIKRVLLSSIDFQADTTQAFQIARHMANKGMKRDALQLLRDIAHVEPLRYDVFALALPLAKETGDVEALRWVCTGILSKAWPKEHASLFDDAQMLAQATLIRMSKEGRVIESTALEQEIHQSLQRDIIVRVNWTGQADLDLRVREPGGTICSLANPVTLSGGTLVGDASGLNEKPQLEGFSEYYVCSQGYSGQYDIVIRRVLGEVSGGKATVEIYTDYGTPEQQFASQVVDLSQKDALIQVVVKNGRRQEPIADTQLAAVRTKQLATSRAVLGQISAGGASADSSASNYNYFRQLQLRNALINGLGFPAGRGAVGYTPVITTLPEGANLSTTGVVSPDRRYVRLSPTPFFTGIGEIFTFNFVTGESGAGGAGIGGGNTGGGGIGGGGGGIF